MKVFFSGKHMFSIYKSINSGFGFEGIDFHKFIPEALFL